MFGRDPYRDDAEALRARNETLTAELRAERKARQAADASTGAARAASDEAQLKLRRLGQPRGSPPRSWYQSGAWAAGCLVLTVLALWPLDWAGEVVAPAKPVTSKVPVQIYMLSKCAYSAAALESLFAASRKLPGRVSLAVDFIVDRIDGTWVTIQGELELRGNKLHLCALEGYDRPRALELIACFNEHWRSLPQGWEACARKIVGDTARLRACYKGPEGVRLLGASAARARRAGALSGPTIVIAGEPYGGVRSVDAIMRALCARMPGDDKPRACVDL